MTDDNMSKHYILAGISADIAQLQRGFIRGDNEQVKNNIDQIITKLDDLKKEIVE